MSLFPPARKRASPGGCRVYAGGQWVSARFGVSRAAAPLGNVPPGVTGAVRALAASSPPLSARSKLTRESGTDFPIPVISPVPDAETEKLIREKDEEVSVGVG